MSIRDAIIFILSLSVSTFVDAQAIRLNKFLSESEAESLWPYSANTGSLFYESIGVLLLKDRVVYFDRTENEMVSSISVLPQKRYSMTPLSISVSPNSYVCVYFDPGIGKHRIALFKNSDNSLIVKRGSHSPGYNSKVVFMEENKSIVSVGPFMSHYEKTLDLYDEDSMTPSKYSLDKFAEFFREQSAYALWKYDARLAAIDSADVIDRSGVDLKEFLSLYQNQVMDVDKRSNIHLIHSSRNYLFRTYSSDFRLIKEFRGENKYFKPIPGTLKKGDEERLMATAGNYSVFYALYAINDRLVSSFYSSTKGWETPTGPYYYDIYSMAGKKEATGVLPYPLFGRDDKKGMYLYVNIESGSWLADDEYYLVEITLDELIAGQVNKKFVLARIRAEHND